MVFKIKDCAIPKVWCGTGKIPSDKSPYSKYIRKGTSYECLQQGIGAGIATSLKKKLPADSLQHIHYIGPVYEKKFRTKGITTQKGLTKLMKTKTPQQIEKFLRGVLQRSDGNLDGRAYNAILIFLYIQGVIKLPSCQKLKYVSKKQKI
jgi:hypothetical protein